MTEAATKSFKDVFYKWFADYLKEKGLQFAQCGSQSNHGIDLNTGGWEKSGSSSKPPRWLYHLAPDTDGALVATTVARNIAHANTGQADQAGLVVRLLPLIRLREEPFHRADEFEVHVLFVFHGATPQGSSSETFGFDPSTGAMRYKGEALPYIACALIGLRNRTDAIPVTIEEDGAPPVVTYKAVLDALSASIQVMPEGATAKGSVPVFDLTDEDELERLKKTVEDAWEAAGPVRSQPVVRAADEEDADDEDDDAAAIVIPDPLEVPENTELLGIEPGVYRQINAALKSGKQHIMLYGPPGTGKTTLARWIASSLTVGGTKWTLITGSADWSSQDIIGGYQPVGGGRVAFVPGVLLRHFDRPLIIDELNRCDIDKVIGPLFTVLSGQQTTLPYRLNMEDTNSLQYVILSESKPEARKHEFAPGPAWRLIATINSIDKVSLYQMSYALSRRFGWVYVAAPRDPAGFIAEFLRKEEPRAKDAPCPLGQFWEAVNKVRVIGPAPIIDAIRAARVLVPGAKFFGPPNPEMSEALLDAIDMVLLPMLDGIVMTDAEFLAKEAVASFRLDTAQAARIKERMKAVAV